MSTSTTTHIGPYRVISLLGSGGMGRVYLAASKSGRAVAVKVVRAELADDPDFRRRFKAEVIAASAVSGAFTTPVVDADPDGPLPWLATAYVPGPSLQDAIETHGPMPEPSLRVLAAGLAEALVAIHNAGVIHRDLKPSNILLAADGPRVIDFGISKVVDGTALTNNGEIIGSAAYMSPEHAMGAALTPASDIYSLGSVVTFAATGQPPFGTGPVHALLFRAAHEQPQLDGVPPALVGIVAACLDKDPARRPLASHLPGWLQPGPVAVGWLGAVADELAAYEQTVVQAVRTPLLRRRSVLIGGGVLIAAALSGGAAYLLQRQSSPELKWTASLPNPDLSVAAVNDTTVVCLNRTGAASFERATGQPLWNGTGGSDTSVRTDGAHVYSVRTDGHLHAVDARTGKDLWTSAASGDQAPKLEQITASTIVTMENGGTCYGVNAADGSTQWTFPSPGGHNYWTQDTTASGQLVLVGESSTKSSTNMQNSYTVLSLDKGTKQWSKDFVAFHAPPDGDIFYAIDDGMNLVGLQASTGQQQWSQPTTLPPGIATVIFYPHSLRLEQGTVICYPMTNGSANSAYGVLAVFDAADGHTLWSVKTSSNEGGYAVAGQTLCYVDKSLKAVDLRTGKPAWTIGEELGKTQLLGPLNDMVLTSVDDSKGKGGLYGWDAKTGRQVWHFPSGGGSGYWSISHVPGGMVATFAGKIYCFQTP